MTARRLAPLGVLTLAVAAALVHLDARQVQRDPPRTAPPPAQAPARDAGKAPSTGTAVIRGVVMSDESTPRPVRRAIVSLSSPGTTGRTTVTDDNGRFGFPDLPAGRFTLGAAKPGWVAASYGVRRAGRGSGTTIALTDGQRVTADLTMLRGGVIAGRILDQFGQPQAGVRPLVLEVRNVGGERTLGAARSSVSSIGGFTDDRGEYRLYGLPPGTYVVAATPPPGPTLTGARLTTAGEIQWARATATSSSGFAAPPPAPGPPVGYAPVFYPGTSDAAAATQIVLEAGAERTGVDFAMILVPMARVAGTVTRSDGLPVQGAQITLSNTAMSHPYDTTTSRTSVSPLGQFSISNVRPGEYRLLARASSRAAPAPQEPAGRGVRPVQTPSLDLYAIAEVTVNGRDVDNVAMALQPGTTMSGRVVYESTTLAPPADATRTQLAIVPPIATAQGVSALTRRADSYYTFAQPDRTFSIPGILPGRYAMNAAANALAGAGGQSWTIKSIVMGGRDVTDVAFEVQPNEQLSDVVVTFTDRSSEIAGTIFDGAGRPAHGYFVFVFPAERGGWLMTSRRFRPPSQPSTDGKYRVGELPPGEYYVAALTEFDQLDMLDQSFLEQVAAASIKVTVKEGERKVQDLKIR